MCINESKFTEDSCSSWPEQDAVHAWLKKYNIDISHKEAMELKNAVTAPRISVQNERDQLLALINSPELHDFSKGVVLEAAHQRERWGSEHDAGKEPADWYWLIGYLAGKALNAQISGNIEKALHHTISTAAALANWHAAITGDHSKMRPGKAYVCTVCGVNPITPELGEDTCHSCLNKI